MEPTKQDAEARLKDADLIEIAVRARAPREHPLYVAMGLTILLIGLVADLNRTEGVSGVVAATLLLVALSVTVGTNLAYLRRHQQVRRRSTPMWVEWALGLWSAAALFAIGFTLQSAVGCSFTLAGLVGALPFLLWAQRLRRTA